MCKITNTQPSYLLHPLDLMGKDHVPSLEFFPGMSIKSEQKLKVFETAITILKKHFELVPMSEFSKRISGDTTSILLKNDKSTAQKSILASSSV
jgi:peptidoglycan-N-acetylglucosamine deacetylase